MYAVYKEVININKKFKILLIITLLFTMTACNKTDKKTTVNEPDKATTVTIASRQEEEKPVLSVEKIEKYNKVNIAD